MNNTNLYLDLYGLHYYNEKLKKYVDDKKVKTDNVTIGKNTSGELEVTERFIQGLKDYISENYASNTKVSQIISRLNTLIGADEEGHKIDVTSIIDTFNEIKDFLANIEDTTLIELFDLVNTRISNTLLLVGIDDIPEFDSTKNYSTNDLVIYSDKLYKFIETHSAGAWIGTDTLETDLIKEIDQTLTETYNLVESINNALAALSPDQQEALGVAAKANANEAKLGYYVCGTDAAVAAKTIAATGYALTKGGNIRIKMTNANTADSATLNINSTGAKALFYNGTQASSTNSWEAGEVVEVYYDGTQYQCASGGGDAENIKYDNSRSGFAADNVQEALDKVVDNTLVGTTVRYTEGYYILSNSKLQSNPSWKASEFLNIDEVSAGDTFVWGGISNQPSACIAFYDDEGTFMQAFSATGASRTITIANNVAAIGATKVRASFLINGTSSLTHNGANVLNNNTHYSIRGIQEIEEELDSLHVTIPSEIESHTLNNSEFIQGTNNASGNIQVATNRCITPKLYDVDNNTTIEVANNGQAHVMLTYDADGTYRGVTTGWVTTDATYTFDAPHKVRFLVSWGRSHTERDITPNQIEVVFTLTTRLKLVEIIDNEIDAKVGKALISDNDSFCRYNKKIKVYNPYKDHPTNQYKGQMHCHTTNSDGGLAPAAVVAKYVGYGYDFMTITDHNYITPNPSPNADIVWMGDSYEDTRNSVGYQHMNVWNCSEVINRTSQYQTTNTPQSLVDHYVKDRDSVLSYNHPEYPPVYASDSTLENLPNGISFVEIYNSTIQTYIGEVNSLPTMANFGDMVAYNGTRYINNSTTKNSPNWQETTAEANPDGNLDRGFRIMLDSGKKVFCDAVDDFHRGDNMENRGWQMVFAHSRTRQSIWNGLLMGASYASTGVSLNDVSFVDGVFKLDIADGANAVTTFYGYNNEVLGTANGATAMYEVTGDEKYVRAMVEIDGKKAWTQPVWVTNVVNQYDF